MSSTIECAACGSTHSTTRKYLAHACQPDSSLTDLIGRLAERGRYAATVAAALILMVIAVTAPSGRADAAEVCTTSTVQVPGMSMRMLRLNGDVWAPGTTITIGAGETVTVSGNVTVWDDYSGLVGVNRVTANQIGERVTMTVGGQAIVTTIDVPEVHPRGQSVTPFSAVLTVGGAISFRHANVVTNNDYDSLYVDGPAITVTRCITTTTVVTTVPPTTTTTPTVTTVPVSTSVPVSTTTPVATTVPVTTTLPSSSTSTPATTTPVATTTPGGTTTTTGPTSTTTPVATTVPETSTSTPDTTTPPTTTVPCTPNTSGTTTAPGSNTCAPATTGQVIQIPEGGLPQTGLELRYIPLYAGLLMAVGYLLRLRRTAPAAT